LQHPGVVPVYDIGRFGDRPFFTMKLVKGQTLQALLSERTDLMADRPRILGIALQVAQTLAYAHAKGVIHRDLKPANIMVGAFGEVQVMDWGLAKVLAEGGAADEEKARRLPAVEGTQIRTARSSGSGFGTETEAGSLLGTPAYMPPEQANGEVALLDRQADVFGLGAILCEILTGKPPYMGRSSEEVRRKACNGDLADATARLDACGADAELIVLAKTCLAPEAIDRPKDAQAVADGLSAYLNGVQERLHQAEVAEAEAKAKAIEEAKRRRLTLALAGTVLLALTLGGGGWLYVKNERDARQAQVAREVNDALNKATLLREQAKAANVGSAALFAQAREQVQRALALVENGPADDTLKTQVNRLQSDLDEEEKDRRLLAALDEARLAQAETRSENRFASERAVPVFREAFRAYGLPAGVGEPGAAAERIRQRPAAVREAVVAAPDEWDALAADKKLGVTEPHQEWLRAVLGAAEPAEGWTRQFRAAREEKDEAKRRAALEKLAAADDVGTLPVRALTRLAGQLQKVEAHASAARLLRRAQQQYPADFWVNEILGMGLSNEKSQPEELTEAVRFLTAAVALRPESPGAYLNLGVALANNGQSDEAIASYRKAIELDPRYAGAHNNLVNALVDKGRVDEAIASCRKALELDPKNAAAHLNLGNALRAKGQVDAAIASYQKALELDPKHARAHNNLGAILCDIKRDYDRAIASFRTAIALDPKEADVHRNLGNALYFGKGQVDAAIASYQKAIALDPKFARAHNNLGDALSRKGQVDAAIASYQKALELDPKFAGAHINLGTALARKGQMDAAVASWRKAIELDPKLAMAHNNLGAMLRGKGEVDAAIACYRKALELDPKFATAHSNLGDLLRAKGQADEAIACYRKVIELDPKNANAHNNLGAILCDDKRDYDAAIACFRKAIAHDPKSVFAHTCLGVALRNKGQVDEAIACCKKAIELDPKYARAHVGMGAMLCDEKRDYDAAIACFRTAIALDPKDALAHSNLGTALRHKGQVDAAIASFKKAIALDPKFTYARTGLAQAERLAAVQDKLPAFLKGQFKPTTNDERRALSEWCQIKKLYRTSAGLSADAFAADPKLADDPEAGHRSSAARLAVLAAAGQGEDSAQLDDKERAGLRQQALHWLRADLALRTKQLESGQPADRAAVQQALHHWQQDSDLAGLRDKDALAKLPAEERTLCTQLWADVAALLKQAEAPMKEDKP
jgi:tetratricopeptide (TPR) repeat protein